VAPFSIAHSFITEATSSATEESSGTPAWIVAFNTVKAVLESLAFMTESLKTFSPKIASGAEFLSFPM
jgi:hypothetical protein